MGVVGAKTVMVNARAKHIMRGENAKPCSIS